MDHHFRKKWGQNFLVDKNLLDKIVSTVNPQANDHILEIGPGEGVLSERILPQVKEMLAVEIDPLLVDQLNKQKNLNDLNIIPILKGEKLYFILPYHIDIH